MAFRVYKPKGLFRIKAEQVTLETIEDIRERVFGQIVVEGEAGEMKVLGLRYPTMEGPAFVPLDDYLVRNDDSTLSQKTKDEFEKAYELAVVRNAS